MPHLPPIVLPQPPSPSCPRCGAFPVLRGIPLRPVCPRCP